ncbi:hypothetical protein KEM52_002209 [Ascosphaera acerosa]|nr:hypothetical protein KEM52_002209 [Ascosphaera acerosa]
MAYADGRSGGKSIAGGSDDHVSRSIVFVHGVEGHPVTTWATTGPSPVFWPRDLLPAALTETPARILSWGYASSVFDKPGQLDPLIEAGVDLAFELSCDRERKGRSQKPLIYVGHSLGGYVVKAAACNANVQGDDRVPRMKALKQSLYGIVFLASPHFDLDDPRKELAIATWHSVSCLTKREVMLSLPKMLEALELRTEGVRRVELNFQPVFPKLRIVSFYETRPTDLGHTKKFIVNVAAAAPPEKLSHFDTAPLAADHQSICRFSGPDDSNFKAVSEVIGRMAATAVEQIARKFGATARDDTVVADEMGC